MAGANLIYGLGMIEMGMTIDYGQLVMDNEFAKMIKYSLQGIPVNDETLAVDVMHDVGPAKDFLGHDHTFRHMEEQSQPSLIDRRMREDWQTAGGKDLYQRALEKARHILEKHEPEPLPDGVQDTMREIVEEAEKELGVDPHKSVK